MLNILGKFRIYLIRDDTQGHEKCFQPKGPSIKDVSPKGGGTKNAQKGDVHYLVDLRRQGEGGYPKNLKFGETSFMDGP